ncbi:MAG TPA: uroporphyrinogen-III synthase [Polyangia bacterium]
MTRPVEQASALATALTSLGAHVVVYPTIALGPPPSWEPFDRAVSALGDYAWLVFTSPSAVRFATERAPGLRDALVAPAAPRVAAVGTETARALRERGMPVAIVPDDQRQEGLVDALDALSPGTRVLFPQALGGRELLVEALVERGVVVDVVPISRTRALPLVDAPPFFDVATFASPSALRAFVTARGTAALDGKVVAVIGPTTAAAARAAGVAIGVMAAQPSVTALVAALAGFRATMG